MGGTVLKLLEVAAIVGRQSHSSFDRELLHQVHGWHGFSSSHAGALQQSPQLMQVRLKLEGFGAVTVCSLVAMCMTCGGTMDLWLNRNVCKVLL